MVEADRKLYLELTSKRVRLGQHGTRTRTITYTLPGDWVAMVEAAAVERREGGEESLQHTVVLHSHALVHLRLIKEVSAEPRHQQVRQRLRSLQSVTSSSALLTAVPSADFFTVGGEAYAFAMRARTGLRAWSASDRRCRPMFT